MIYPWQNDQWKQVWQAHQVNRLSHALLLSGNEGVGKLAFAHQLIQSLLCKQVNSDGSTCGICHDCSLVNNNSHPNLLTISPEKAGHAIKVDQIRAVSDFINQSSLQGQYRAAIIHPAHNMNINAANALLKTLEEPPTGAIIILVTESYSHLPVTVISRCQRIVFPLPNQKTALKWLKDQSTESVLSTEQLLKLANGAPLLAINLCNGEVASTRDSIYKGLSQLVDKRASVLELSTSWHSMDFILWLELMRSWLVDVLRLQSGANIDQITNTDYQNDIKKMSDHFAGAHTLVALDKLRELSQQLKSGINTNKQLAIEDLLIQWSGA